jgi:hypothetical protein
VEFNLTTDGLSTAKIDSQMAKAITTTMLVLKLVAVIKMELIKTVVAV